MARSLGRRRRERLSSEGATDPPWGYEGFVAEIRSVIALSCCPDGARPGRPHAARASFGLRVERPRSRSLRRLLDARDDEHVSAARVAPRPGRADDLDLGRQRGCCEPASGAPVRPRRSRVRVVDYDRAIERANDAGIQVLLTIVGTPAWANGGQPPSRSPSSSTTLRQFAFAAALRYSGTYLDPESGRILPRVGLWLAWNEPNNPVFLTPQFVRVRGNWRMASPTAYAHICNAIYAGVHAVGGPEQVACGATAPRGSNQPNGFRPSIAPLAFLVAVKKAGLRTFDAWAHHPYYGAPEPDTGDTARRPARDRARQHRHPDREADEAVRPEAGVDHRVRLPDQAAGRLLRRELEEAGGIPA